MRGLAVVLACLTVAGCGSLEFRGAGRVAGATLTVYSIASLHGPTAGSDADIVAGQRLALAAAGGRAGIYTVNFAALDDAAAGAVTDERAAAMGRDAIADLAVGALIGPTSSASARVLVPLADAAGLLQVLPGAAYGPLTESRGDGGRYWPTGTPAAARLTPGTSAQAAALRRRAGARAGWADDGSPEGRAITARGGGPVTRATRTVVYAGVDPERARADLVRLLAARPQRAVLINDALARTDLLAKLPAAVARRTRALTVAPEPGSTPGLRAFERSFRAAYGRDPGPYAAVGHEAMRSVLAAIAAAGVRANERAEIRRRYFALGRDGLLGRAATTAEGDTTSGTFSLLGPGQLGR